MAGKRKKTKGYGLLPPKSRDRIAKAQNRIRESSAASGARSLKKKWMDTETEMKEGTEAANVVSRVMGKYVAFPLMFSYRHIGGAFVPPHRNFAPDGGINRLALYTLGGEKGRKRALDMRKGILKRHMDLHRPIIETQLREIVEENGWQRHFREGEEFHQGPLFGQMVDIFTENRARHFMLGEGFDTGLYWITMGMLARDIFHTATVGGRIVMRTGAEVAAEEATGLLERGTIKAVEHETVEAGIGLAEGVGEHIIEDGITDKIEDLAEKPKKKGIGAKMMNFVQKVALKRLLRKRIGV